MDRETIHRVEARDEFSICPLCGYTDAFHTALLRSGVTASATISYISARTAMHGLISG